MQTSGMPPTPSGSTISGDWKMQQFWRISSDNAVVATNLAAGRRPERLERLWQTEAVRRLVTILALLSACSNPTSPSPALAGTWAENFSIVGASLVLAIDASGNGSGTYAIEAGRSGAVQVMGTVGPTTVTLTIRYDYGAVRTFTGTLTDNNHLTGTFNDSAGTVVFVRR